MDFNKNKMRKLILILCLIPFLGCKNKLADTSSQENDSTASVSIESIKNKEQTRDCKQTFEEFFERFSRDSIYQKSRVKYPFKWSYLEDNESNEMTVDILNSIDDYDYIDFTSDKDESGKYETIIERKEKQVNYILKGKDNGLLMNHIFKVIDGCWYMVEILDEST